MIYKFTQFEVESAINKTLAFGDETQIASRTGRGSSYYSQMFNPDDDRESNFHKVLREICAEIDVDRERGIALFCLFKSFVERHIETDEQICPVGALEEADKEFSDIWKARLKGKTKDAQLLEVEQAEMKIKILKQAIANELRDEAREEIIRDNFADLKTGRVFAASKR